MSTKPTVSDEQFNAAMTRLMRPREHHPQREKRSFADALEAVRRFPELADPESTVSKAFDAWDRGDEPDLHTALGRAMKAADEQTTRGPSTQNDPGRSARLDAFASKYAEAIARAPQHRLRIAQGGPK